ncbi:MAG: hypothetical protein MUD00_03690 [Candidatus Pacebacteria bacterium]|jgi:hypothetical protein|nr:hypothetical protein [Candidatus Paceibacterota bacterium]
MVQYSQNGGFLRLILIIVIGLLILGYFNIDLQRTVESTTTQKNVSYIKNAATTIWENYLEGPVMYFWNNIFINLLWNSFTKNLENIQNEQPTDFQINAPTINVSYP